MHNRIHRRLYLRDRRDYGRDVSKEIQGARPKSDCGHLETEKDIRIEMGDGLLLVSN